VPGSTTSTTSAFAILEPQRAAGLSTKEKPQVECVGWLSADSGARRGAPDETVQRACSPHVVSRPDEQVVVAV
jgi:hypothetical protein